MDLDLVPASYTLLRISISDIINTRDIDLADLPADWKQQPATTRRLGDEWLDRNDVALLQVPSAIVPDAWNMLLNPAHTDAVYANITAVISAPFNPRLLRRP